MKPRILVLALLAAFGSGCTSMDKPKQALRIEPIMAIRHSGPDAQSYYQLGRYYHGQNRLELAEKAYLKAVAADERNVDAFNALGSLYAARGQLEKSAKMFEKVTAMAPNAAYLHNNLGFAYYLQGRLDEAYLAVRKALGLDPTLERGWANLEKIAATSTESLLIEATKSRRLEALPTELALNSIRDESTAAPEPSAIAQSPSPSPKPDLALERPTQPNNHSVAITESTRTGSVELAPVNASASVTTRSAPAVPLAQENESRIFGGKFVLLSTNREVVSNGGTIEIMTEKSAGASNADQLDKPISAARIEVSNGNGVGGFARKFGSQLRQNNMRVTRITNHDSFSLDKTVIQYDPRYEDEARALMSQFTPMGRLIPATKPRAGADIRIVLGRDATQSRWRADELNI